MARYNKTWQVYFATVMVVSLFIAIAFWFYDNAKSRVYDETLRAYHQSLSHDIQRLIESQRESSMAIALSLSTNPKIEKILCQNCVFAEKPKLNFDNFLEDLDLYANYKTLWIQVFDAKGVSRYRSWTNQTGDLLVEVRKDVREMLRVPKVANSLSVDRFSLTLKSMVPIFDKNQHFLGAVELISHTDPLIEKLQKEKMVESVVLVDKRYRKQLIETDEKRFIDDYFVVNAQAKPRYIALLKQLGEQSFVNKQTEKVLDGLVLTQNSIYDDNGVRIGLWFTFEPLEQVSFANLEHINRQFAVLLAVLMLFASLLAMLYVSKKRSEIGRSYYRHVLDSASEIIFVSNHLRIIEANQQFFEFFSQFSSINAFLEQYPCICDTFVEAKGFLQKEMNGQFWLDYVLNTRDKQHKAQIKKNGKLYYFEVKVAQIDIYEKPLFSVIMHDITSQELYKQQLEYLSETDVLTGVSNRLVFNRTLVKEIQRAHRYHSELSLLMFDIDFFKNINDSYGHDVGDQVLITLCEIISQLLRETDVFCRVGGEEFAIIMVETNLEQATQTAERLRKAIEDMEKGVLPTSLTVSFGVAAMTRWDSDKTIFRRADEALYQAKENGRNRVEVAQES